MKKSIRNFKKIKSSDIWNAENIYHLKTDTSRIGKLIYHYEIYKKITNIPGDIIECGVFKGAGIFTWVKLLKLFKPNNDFKVIGFDFFKNKNRPKLKYKLDKKVVDFHKAGAISQKDLFKKCEEWNFKNLKLYAGDVKKTSKKYARESLGSRIALLYLDVDNYEGTLEILKNLYTNINITKIYNFPSRKLKPSGRLSLRKKLNISYESKIFLYQGVLHEGRGIKTLIQLLDNFQNAHAIIIGDGPYRNELQKYAINRNTEKRTHFYGAVPYLELLELTADADIGFSLIKPISKSYEQALPNKLFEYALAGIPVIASNFPEMDKIINYFNILSEVDTSGVSEMTHVTDTKNVTREDESGECIKNSELIDNCPETFGQFIKVPKSSDEE